MTLGARLKSLLRRQPVPLAIGTVFVLQIYFFQWHPGYPNPNEVIRIYLTRAIVEDGTFQVDQQIRRFGNVEDKARRAGHTYCDKAPGLSFAAVVPFAVARLFGDLDMKTSRHLIWLTVIVLPGLLLLLALWRFLERFGLGRGERSLLLLAFGLGSLQFTFSTVVFSHGLAAVLAAAAFLAVSSYRHGSAGLWTLAAGGFAAGFAVITEYPVAIPLFFVFLSLCIGPTWRRAWVFALAAIPPVALGLFYNWSSFGHPLATGYSFLTKAFFAAVHDTGFLGVSTPRWAAFSGSFLGTSRGLLYFAPWLVLALPGLYLLMRRRGWRAEGWVCLGALLGYGYFISSFGYWQGGGTVGQRHLTPLVPFLLLPVAEVLRRRPAGGWGFALGAGSRTLVIVGIVLTVGCSIPWPYVSPAYLNPWPEISLPMWLDGVLPPALLETVGLPLWPAVAPFLLLLGGALAWIATGPRDWSGARRILHFSAVTTLSALALLGATWLNWRPRAQARNVRDRAGIARLVDPAGRRPARRAERRLMDRSRRGALTAAQARRLGYLRARRGDVAGALHWYRRAQSLAR